MKDFLILTDSTADLPKDYAKEHNVKIASIPYSIDGQSYGKNKELNAEKFYELMKQGIMPTTSQINPEDAKDFLEECLEECPNLLLISFSEALSGTYNSYRLAIEGIKEKRECNIVLVDSKSASLGEGLVVHKAVMMKKENKSLEEIAQWLEEHILNFVQVFTVDDLFHLYRGGRIDKKTAIVGSVINVKPILHVNDEGKLVSIGKTRGRKKSLNHLVDYMQEHIGEYNNDIVFISHGNVREDAEYVRNEIEKRFGIKKFIIHTIGPSIGAHSGPGTVALFFMGEKR